jgi:hypothetical protein
MDHENIAIPYRTLELRSGFKNEEACGNKRKPLRINGEKHDEMLLPITPLSV